MGSSKAVGKKRIILGVTGASGAVFARRTLQMLEADARVETVHLVVSGSGIKLLRDELDLDVSRSSAIPSALAVEPTRKTEYHSDSDIGASIASGSYAVDGMVVIPCTTGCLAQIATGISDTLIERAADVCLKESRPLILCVRDTPFNRIHLENMLRAQSAGAVIFPIIPTYYHRPQTIEDLVIQFCCRVLALLDLEQPDQYRWEGEDKRRRIRKTA
jgi:flavin prenyltransferase